MRIVILSDNARVDAAEIKFWTIDSDSTFLVSDRIDYMDHEQEIVCAISVPEANRAALLLKFDAWIMGAPAPKWHDALIVKDGPYAGTIMMPEGYFNTPKSPIFDFSTEPLCKEKPE